MVTFHTNHGDIVIKTFDDKAPETVKNFLNFSGESLQGWGYCVFAEVVEGMDVVDKIKGVATGRSGMHQDVPKEDVIIENVTVSE
ncbi:hypothetical protein G6C61_003418 [Salmonella enterica]|nr:hypothetical protein [Salmonella enterica]